MNESSEVGRGRGRTRWIVTGGEGSVVARLSASPIVYNEEKRRHTLVQYSIDHFSLYIPSV